MRVRPRMLLRPLLAFLLGTAAGTLVFARLVPGSWVYGLVLSAASNGLGFLLIWQSRAPDRP